MAYVGSGGTRPMQAGGFIHALDVQNGQEAWRFGAERGFYSSPALHPSQALLICGNRDGHVYALNTATGELRWQYSTEHEIVSTPAISIEHNLVCVASDDAKLHVIHADSGKRAWSFKTGRALLDSSPAIAHDKVFLAGKDGVFRTFDLLTGQLLWVIERAADGEPDTFASPSVAAGLVYAACSDGTLTAWDVVTGHEVWQLEMPVTTTTWTSSAVGNGMLCIGAGHDQSVFLVE